MRERVEMKSRKEYYLTEYPGGINEIAGVHDQLEVLGTQRQLKRVVQIPLAQQALDKTTLG